MKKCLMILGAVALFLLIAVLCVILYMFFVLVVNTEKSADIITKTAEEVVSKPDSLQKTTKNKTEIDW